MKSLLLSLIALILVGCSSAPPQTVPHASSDRNRLVVFDIDGTLTPTNSAIFSVRKDAANAVTLYHQKGYEILYLSARVKLFKPIISHYLKENHFPEGMIIVPHSPWDEQHPDLFKARILQESKSKGWKIAAAYGDSSSDFAAYRAANISPKNVYALKRENCTQCQSGIWKFCLNSWSEHLTTILKKY